MRRSFLAENPSVLWFISILAVFTLAVALMSEVTGVDLISTSFVKTLGKTLCLCLIALAMDLIWGYAGILSLGHFAFFALGGYMIGMWLMFGFLIAFIVKFFFETRCVRVDFHDLKIDARNVKMLHGVTRQIIASERAAAVVR